jgi:hypothetical protein
LLSSNVKVKIYKTIILPVVLYGCETWSLTLRKEHRLRVFENKVLRRIFGPKRYGLTGDWRKLQNEEHQKERDHLEDRGIDGRMGSEWILGRLSGV